MRVSWKVCEGSGSETMKSPDRVTKEHKVIWCTDMHLYAYTFNVSLSTVIRLSRVSRSSLHIKILINAHQ